MGLSGRSRRDSAGGSARSTRWRRPLRGLFVCGSRRSARRARNWASEDTPPLPGGRGGRDSRPISGVHFHPSHRGAPARLRARSQWALSAAPRPHVGGGGGTAVRFCLRAPACAPRRGSLILMKSRPIGWCSGGSTLVTYRPALQRDLFAYS